MRHTCSRLVRGWTARALPLLVLALLVGCGSPYKQGDVVVSLAFDNGFAESFDSHAMLAQRDQHATWFIAADNVDQSGYLSKAQLLTLQQEGHEIGGQMPLEMRYDKLLDFQIEYQVCKARADLQAMGLLVDTFSYGPLSPPEVARSATAGCGFTAGRLSTGLADRDCRGCAWAETVPPQNPFAVRTLNAITAGSTLVGLQSRVGSTHFQKGGGWLVFLIHHVCAGTNCPYDSADPQLLDQLSAWLAQKGFPVRPIRDVTAGP